MTHWGWVMHICVNKLTIIGSDNGLSPGRRQAIVWTNAGIMMNKLSAKCKNIDPGNVWWQCNLTVYSLTTTKSSTLLVLCMGKLSVTGGFPPQRVSNVESISMTWRHHIIPEYDHRYIMYSSIKFMYKQTKNCTPDKMFAVGGWPWPYRIESYVYLWFKYGMMTSSNGNIFRVTGHLCGKFTGPRWISRTKASDAELWCFLWFTSE